MTKSPSLRLGLLLLALGSTLPSWSQSPPLEQATAAYLETFKTGGAPAATAASAAPSAPVAGASAAGLTPSVAGHPRRTPSATAVVAPKLQHRTQAGTSRETAAPRPMAEPQPTPITLELHAVSKKDSEWSVYLAINGHLYRFKNGDQTPCGPLTVLDNTRVQVGSRILQI